MNRDSHPPLRVITWNLRKGKGANGTVPTLQGLADFVREYDPAVVLLQEVFHATACPGAGQSDELARLLEMSPAFGPNMFYRRGCHGNAILSRLPIVESMNLDLSTNRVERRGAVYARLETPDGNLHVVSIHLGLNAMQRRRQVRRFATILEDRVPEGEPLVIGGDFNDWTGRLHRRILARFRVDGALDDVPDPDCRSFPSGRPRFGLDRIYVRHANVETARVLHLGT